MSKIPKVVAALDHILHPKHQYEVELEARNYEVTQDERTNHLHYLNVIIPILKTLKDHHFRVFLNDKKRFSEEERNIVLSALQVLDNSLVPVVLMKVVESDEEKQKDAILRMMLNR